MDSSAEREENDNAIPELTRLHSFIKELEDELECETTEDMFKAVCDDMDSKLIESELDLDRELQDISVHDEESVAKFLDQPLSPVEDLYKGFTPHETPYFGTHSRSNLDIFLLALAEAGYANVDPGKVKDEESTGYTTLANEFFDSALDSDDHSPIMRPCSSESSLLLQSGASSESKHSIHFSSESISAESLRRNWDLDDDEDDSSSGGNTSPKSPFPAVKYSKTNSNMQFPDLMSSPTSPAPKNSAISPGGSSKSNIDPRLHGDFNVWSGGPMLSAEAVHREYLGLHSTALTHHISEGKLVPSADLAERLSVAGSQSERNARNFYEGPYDFQYANDSTKEISSPYLSRSSTASGSRGIRDSNPSRHTHPSHVLPFYYNRHVMECVLRPDRELKQILSLVSQFFFERDYTCHQLQSNHLVILGSRSSGTDASTLKTEAVDDITSIPLTYSSHLIDIQVCLSRELKQRILLIQFLYRVPQSLIEAMGFGTMGLFGTSVLISTGILPDTLPLRACPVTRKIAVQLKKMIIGEQLSLSALYSVPIPDVCALPRGLDTHFLALLQSLTREQLWARLKEEYKTMDSHVKVMEDNTNQFSKLLESIYKAYGMSIQGMQYKPQLSLQQKLQPSSFKNKSPTTNFPFTSIPKRESISHTKTYSAMQATVSDDKLVAIQQPFPTSDTAVSTPASQYRASEDFQLQRLPNESLNESVVRNNEKARPRPQSLTVPVVDSQQSDHLPPSALKSSLLLSPRKTPGRSVTIRLDTNTFHDAPSESNESSSQNNFSTPTRAVVHSMAAIQSNEFPETPLSALTNTPQTPPPTANSNDDDTLTSISLGSTFSIFSDDSKQRKTKALALMTGPVSPNTARAILQADMSPASVKVRLQEQYSQNAKVDGMVFCLIMRDKIVQELQNSCDQEYAEKMCNRHNLTLVAVQDLAAHKKALLMAIICHPSIHKSSLMKTFHSTFQGVSVTRWVSSQNIVGTATILRPVNEQGPASATKLPLPQLAPTKSLFGSFFGSSSSATAENGPHSGPTPRKSDNEDCNSLVISSSFPIQNEVVLYYFTMLTNGGQQGTIYLTARYLCMVSSLMGFINTKKEIFLLSDLTEYSVTTSGEALNHNSGENVDNHMAKHESVDVNNGTSISGVAAGLFSHLKLLKLVFQSGQRELLLRPLLVDAARVQMVFAEILANFRPSETEDR